MFRVGNFEAEIAKAMAENLSTSLLKKQAADRKIACTLKIAQAVDHLDKAAIAFENLGFVKETQDVLKLLQKIADGKEHHHTSHQEPEVFEMDSLLREPEDKEDEGEDDLGEQIIEMRSIASAILKKKV